MNCYRVQQPNVNKKYRLSNRVQPPTLETYPVQDLNQRASTFDDMKKN